ncbi:MAG TPA: LPS export ABC transporter periplasmic protein LptC, partial [Candidatus Binatia bacterium]|nr:LPS export ABC transporter periplasmic protein LptC [Candidatus Binatia bacterium]
MPLPVYHLRRWLLVMAALFIAMIAGVYFYARVKQRNVLKEVPNKLGIEIKQTANGFQFSKSDGKRTQFTVQAGSVKQFKLDGSAELRNVSIILYGRDSSRFDRISGDAFSYDKKTGDVIGRGDVQIDLHANPSGQSSPDLSAPERLKNPIHLKTRDLVFNQNSGDAYTDARVDFTTPQATGWAVGAHYAGKNNTLTIVSQIHVTLTGPDAATILATHGVFTREPHEIVLEHARMERSAGVVQAEEATFFLGPDNNVERVFGTGNVSAETAASDSENTRARADQGEMFLAGRQNLLRTATLTGHVHIERDGPQAMAGDAGSAVLDFAGRNEIRKIHAADGVHLAQHAAASAREKDSASQPQDFDITAPVIDFFLADGRRLDHAVTSGDAKIAILPAQNSTGESG